MTIGVSTFVTDWRVTVETVRRDNEWNLIINDVQHDDEGIYQCQINTKDDQSNFYNIYLHIKSQCQVPIFFLAPFIYFTRDDVQPLRRFISDNQAHKLLKNYKQLRSQKIT